MKTENKLEIELNKLRIKPRIHFCQMRQTSTIENYNFYPKEYSFLLWLIFFKSKKELGPRYHLYFKTYSRWGNSKAVSHALRNRIYTYGSSFLPQLITKNLLVIFAMSLANQNPSKYSKLQSEILKIQFVSYLKKIL